MTVANALKLARLFDWQSRTAKRRGKYRLACELARYADMYRDDALVIAASVEYL